MLIRVPQPGDAGAPRIFLNTLSEEKKPHPSVTHDAPRRAGNSDPKKPGWISRVLQPSCQHRAWTGRIQAPQPACYAKSCSVSAHCNLCPWAVAFPCKVETTLGCGLTNTSLQSSAEKILASAKMSSYFLLMLLCTRHQLSWERLYVIYAIAK